MKKIFTQVLIILLVSFHFNLISLAQDTYTKVWDKSFGGSNADTLQIMRPTKDGGYILGGTSNSLVSGAKTAPNKGREDFWLVKIDAAGTKQWDKTFGGSGADLLQDIQQTKDGGYILGGTSYSPVSGNKSAAGSGKSDYWVVKIDAAGIKKWDKTYGGSSNENLRSIRQTTDGGYILGGTSDSPVSGKTGYSKTTALIGKNDYWLVKTDAAGIKKWDKTYGGTSFDYLQDLQQTKDGGYIIGGHSFSSENGNKTTNSKGFGDFWIIKTDINGTQLWDHTFGGALDEALVGILPTPDNGYIAAGTSKSNISGDKSEVSKGYDDYWLVKLDGYGDKIWDKTYGGLNNDYLQVLTATSDGGFMLGGTSSSSLGGDKTANSNGNSDFWIVKVDANGNKNWDKTIGGNDYDNLRSIEQTSSGAYILAGTSNSAVGLDKSSASAGESDFWVVKLSTDGTEQPPVLNQKVESFTLVNADTEQDIQTITTGTTLNLAALPTRNLNIRANTSTNSLDSVVFQLSGAKTLHVMEKNPPYILFGAVGSNYNAWTPVLGSYTLTGTTYSTTTDSDTVGTALVVSFVVMDLPVGNTLPIASAGTDKTITLPTSSVTLNGSGTDAEGPITKYTWSQVSGPAIATFSSKAVANPTVTGLIAGTYTFSLLVTDNQNAVSSADQVVVKVNNNTSTGSPIVSLTLINADTDRDILTINNGAVINLATLPSKNLNIRANTNSGTVGSVVMAMSGRWNITKTESAPYTLFGDQKYSNGVINYGGVALPTGTYTVKSTPYTGTKASGTAGTPLIISFKIINQATSVANNANAYASAVNPTSKQEITVAKPATFTSFPNPFQDQATIQFTFAQEEEYKVEVYNLNGDLVSHLKSAKAAAGETIQTTWHAGQNKNGIYVIKLTTKQAVQHLRVIRSK